VTATQEPGAGGRVLQSCDAEEIRTIFAYFARATAALVAAVEELSGRPDA
jgi:hypothetical protein